jgi:predicted nuclease with TOPRIM domain
MREQVQMRLEVLKKELEAGQAELEKVEKQRAYLHETMLRISGAVQVLEELLAEGQPAGQDGSGPSETLHHAPAQTGGVNMNKPLPRS